MRILLIAVILFAMLFVPAALAQDEVANPTCTPEDWQEIQDGIVEQASALATSEDPLTQLLVIETYIDAARGRCVSDSFTSEDYPNGIIGPFVLSGSLYEVAFTVDESTYGNVNTVDLDDTCSLDFKLGIDTSTEGGTETNLWQFEEPCAGMLEVDTTRPSSWSLTITRLR